MDRINAFIGHSARQKVLAGRFKVCLVNYCGYDSFLAHEDIPGSALWEEEIIKGIENADFFIPLLSEEFKSSNFTDQEIGIAVALKKKIIPIMLDDINPYGFINKYQGLQYKPPSPYRAENLKELALTISQIGLHYDKDSIYHQKAVNSTLHAFCTSHSFITTNTAIETIITYNDFSLDHLKQIESAVKTNSQIRDAYGLSKLKKFLLEAYNFSID